MLKVFFLHLTQVLWCCGFDCFPSVTGLTAAPTNDTWSVGRAHNTCSLDFNIFLKACHPLSWTPAYMLLANAPTLVNNLPLAFGIHSFFKACGQNQCTGCLRGKHLRWGAFLGKVWIFSSLSSTEHTDFWTLALLWIQMDDLKPASYPACRWGRSPGEWGRLHGRGVPHDRDRFSAAQRPNGTRSQGSGKGSLARWGWLTEKGEWEKLTAWTQTQPPQYNCFWNKLENTSVNKHATHCFSWNLNPVRVRAPNDATIYRTDWSTVVHFFANFGTISELAVAFPPSVRWWRGVGAWSDTCADLKYCSRS